MTKLEKHLNYFNQIDKSKLKFIEGWTPKKEHVKNTMSLYFENIHQTKNFSKSQFNQLEDWLHDIAKIRKKFVYTDLPYNKPLKTEAVEFNKKIILKECLNLIKFIASYYDAYILKTKNDDSIMDTIYDLSYDKRRMKQRLSKYSKTANNLRLNKKDRARYILIKRMLSLLVSKKYEKRARFYIFSIILNYSCINWDKLLTFDDNEDTRPRKIIEEVIRYFMYENYSEDKIKHSLMILVFTFLTKRMYFQEEDALNLTNRLCSDILFEIDSRSDYTKEELSKDIYLHSVFDYLPIFLHQKDNNKRIYTEEEQKKIAHTIKKQSIILDERFKSCDIDKFIDIFKNAHISYINTDLTYIYETKHERN